MMRHSLATSIVCLALAALGVSPASAQLNRNPASAHVHPEAVDPLDAFVLDRMAELGIPGVSLAVLRGNEVVKLAAYGKANLELDVPASPETVFPYASMTKAFAGTAILRLVERGRLSLDDSVVELLSGLPETWSAVTVRQLLSHTSGLPDVALYASVSNPMVLRDMLIATTLDSAMAVLPTLPVQFVAGHGVAYNQTNYLLLALLLERLDGRTIEDYVAQEFAQPLGLTTLAFGDSRAIVAGRASWYTRTDYSTGRPEPVSLRPVWIEYPNFLHTAAGLNGTALDVARFVAAVVSGEALGGVARQELWKPATLADGSVARMGPFGVALGWFVDAPPGRSVTFGGGGSAAVRYYIDDDLTVAVLTNLQGGDPYALLDGVAKAYLTEAGVTPSDTIHVAPPMGEREADRASILAAVERVLAGGTVQFARGTYIVGRLIRIATPGITLLGHPDGTTLHGCEAGRFDDVGRDMAATWLGELGPDESLAAVEGCDIFELTGGHATVRGLTFERAWSGLLLGCCEAEFQIRPTDGGYLIEDNLFRNIMNGVRGTLWAAEPTVIRRNRFVNTFHAVVWFGSRVHMFDNHVSVPDPAQLSVIGFPAIAIGVLGGTPPRPPTLPDVEYTAAVPCDDNVIGGNLVEGHPDGITIVAFPGTSCRHNVIRDNTIVVSTPSFDRSRPSGRSFGADDTAPAVITGVPVSLFAVAEQDGRSGGVEESVVEGNRVTGAHGVGIELVRASGNRIANNTITGIRRRDPFPGNVVGTVPEWADANGAGIWVSGGSDENEIVGNTFEDIASHTIILEGDRSRVETRSPGDTVRDLGTDNRVQRSRASDGAREPGGGRRMSGVDSADPFDAQSGHAAEVGFVARTHLPRRWGSGDEMQLEARWARMRLFRQCRS